MDQPQESPPQESSPRPSFDDLPTMVAEVLSLLYRQEGIAAQGFQSLREQVESLSEQLKSAPANMAARSVSEGVPAETANAPEPAAPEDPPAPVELPPQAEQVPQAVVPQPVQPVQDVRPVTAHQFGGGELEDLVFGQDLAFHESLAPLRQELIRKLRGLDPTAMVLVGQLLTFRASSPDKMAPLLKELGEAWYGYDSSADGSPSPLRDALIHWLHSKLDAAGLGNRIELVRIGDRFDSKRHNAKSRGVEVSQVGGWVVLRDSGSTYTKATVEVI